MKGKSFFVGIFVLIALAIGLGAIFVLGAKDAFNKTTKYALFFKGDMTGLSRGAPVVFRGVQIGEVTEVRLVLNKNLNVTVPVIIEITAGVASKSADTEADFDEYIHKGLCAQLAQESIVTGKLMIKLNFVKDPKKKRYKEEYHGQEKIIPTVASDFDELKESLRNIPIKSLMDSLAKSLEGIEQKINSKELSDTMTSLNRSVKNLEVLIKNSNQELKKISKNSNETITNANQLIIDTNKSVNNLTNSVNTSLNNFNTLSNTLNTKSNQLGDELIKTTKETNVAIGEMKKLLTQYRNVMEPDSPVYDGLLEAINNFNEASQSITEFTNYLNRHPESLIRGRKGE